MPDTCRHGYVTTPQTPCPACLHETVTDLIRRLDRWAAGQTTGEAMYALMRRLLDRGMVSDRVLDELDLARRQMVRTLLRDAEAIGFGRRVMPRWTVR